MITQDELHNIRELADKGVATMGYRLANKLIDALEECRNTLKSMTYESIRERAKPETTERERAIHCYYEGIAIYHLREVFGEADKADEFK